MDGDEPNAAGVAWIKRRSVRVASVIDVGIAKGSLLERGENGSSKRAGEGRRSAEFNRSRAIGHEPLT
jgi:hypothetical protein